MAAIQFPSPMIFAHRGASAYAPENTMASFRLAVEQGADGIELDVKLSADGEVVVLHDQKLDRTTDLSGDLRGYTLQKLIKADAGSKFNPKFAGEQIPTLGEVLAEFGQKLYINIELTNYATPFDDLVNRVVVLVRRYGLESRVLFSSFNPMTLRLARQKCPSVPIGFLTYTGILSWFARSTLGVAAPFQALHPYLDDVTPNLIEGAHRSGKRVHVWTVNGDENIRKMFRMGVDAVFTDQPDIGRAVLLERM